MNTESSHIPFSADIAKEIPSEQLINELDRLKFVTDPSISTYHRVLLQEYLRRVQQILEKPRFTRVQS